LPKRIIEKIEAEVRRQRGSVRVVTLGDLMNTDFDESLLNDGVRHFWKKLKQTVNN